MLSINRRAKRAVPKLPSKRSTDLGQRVSDSPARINIVNEVSLASALRLTECGYEMDDAHSEP
jgi:hypothetical protein